MSDGKGAVGAGTYPSVCTENLNPNVVVMKSAQDDVRTYDACVYRQLKRGRSGDEVRPGWRVN
jgi:hypothetical protein